MKTGKNIYLVLSIITLTMLFMACGAVKKITKTDKTYYDFKKQDEKITVSYKLPIIKATAKTQQSQTKGGIIISAEIVPFQAIRNTKQEETVTYADITKPGYDNYEVSNTPYYIVTPENIQFKIRIRNNEQVPLKLSEVGFALIIDGTQWSFPTGYLDDWNKGLILTGFEKEYIVNGPQLEGLYSAQVVYLFLNGVPISYNEAGSVTKKSNFEWYFECKAETVQKDEIRNYSYEAKPIFKEKCTKCSGTGVDPKSYKCSYCDGKGTYVNQYDKKTYKCPTCSGSGIVHYKCGDCAGLGVIAYPKSTEAPVKNSITWTGWKVNVITNPPGAKVSMVDTKTGEYKSVGISNIEDYWFSSDTKSYPIIVEYQSQILKVLPFDEDGKATSKVIVDFSSGSSTVKEGKKIN